MLAREAPVSAVSLAAKNAETSRQPTTTKNAIECMASNLCVGASISRKAGAHFSGSYAVCQLPRQKISHRRGLHVRRDCGAADRLQQDEGELAAPDLLVLRHQRHQGIGVRQPFLREACDILQP